MLACPRRTSCLLFFVVPLFFLSFAPSVLHLTVSAISRSLSLWFSATSAHRSRINSATTSLRKSWDTQGEVRLLRVKDYLWDVMPKTPKPGLAGDDATH